MHFFHHYLLKGYFFFGCTFLGKLCVFDCCLINVIVLLMIHFKAQKSLSFIFPKDTISRSFPHFFRHGKSKIAKNKCLMNKITIKTVAPRESCYLKEVVQLVFVLLYYIRNKRRFFSIVQRYLFRQRWQKQSKNNN